MLPIRDGTREERLSTESLIFVELMMPLTLFAGIPVSMNAHPAGSRVAAFIPPLWIVSLIAVALFVWLLVMLKEIVVLLVVGYCLAYAIEPIVAFLERRGVSRSFGVGCVFAAVILFLVGVVITVVPALAAEYTRLAENLPQYFAIAREKLSLHIESYRHLLPEAVQSKILSFSLSDLAPVFDAQVLKNAAGAVFGFILQGYSVTLTLVNLTLLPFIVFYLSVEFSRWHHRAVFLFPPNLQPTVLAIAREIDFYTSAFVRGQFLVCTILFVLYGIGLWLLDIQLWFLLALLSGFGNMVPFLGFLVGIVLSSIMALVSHGDLQHLVLVWILYGVVQALEGNFITPKVLGNRVGLGQLSIILALFAGGSLFGLLGLFLAVPVAAALRVVFDRAHAWLYEDSDHRSEPPQNSSPNQPDPVDILEEILNPPVTEGK